MASQEDVASECDAAISPPPDQQMAPPTKAWSFQVYKMTQRNGFHMLFTELKSWAKELSWPWHRIGPTERRRRPSLPEDWLDGRKCTSLRYGFEVLACLCSAAFLVVPGHLIDMRLGSIPDKRFVIFIYVCVIISMITGGIAISNLASFISPLPLESAQIKFVFNLTMYLSELGYHVISLVSCAFLVYKRQFIHRFIIHECSIISLPAKYQRRQIICLFACFYLLTIISEPLFVTLTLASEINQSTLPQIDARLLPFLKWPVILISGFGMLTNAAVGIFIPLVTTYLSVSIAAHLRIVLYKQVARWKGALTSASQQQLATDRLGQQAELDQETRQIVHDYSCDTLTSDWPQLVESGSTLSSALALNHHHHHHKQHQRHHQLDDQNDNHELLSAKLRSRLGNARRSSTKADGMLFLYKNLLKSMSELKSLISSYERQFSGFHLVFLSVDCFNVTQWITCSLYESEVQNALTSGTVVMTSFNVRVLVRVVTFVVSNFYLFLVCNRLTQQLAKLYCQLFRINVDLVRADMGHMPSAPEMDGRCGSAATMGASRTPPSAGMLVDQKSSEELLELSYELEQIWLLFDQTDRMRRYSRFKLTNSIYYDKRCLLLVIGQMISFVMLFIQLVELYTYV
jgi:hypothetical protein